MKKLDKVIITLTTLSLLVFSILLPAIAIASSESYYAAQFAKTGVYGGSISAIGGERYLSACFTDSQLNSIIRHIIDYLFTNKLDSFALTMDGVTLNGVLTDGVSIFGEEAVKHMADVKHLFTLAIVLCAVSGVMFAGGIAYIIIRRRNTFKFIIRYSLIVYGVVIALAAAFLIWTAVAANGGDFADTLWTNMHVLFFPFSPEKQQGSFFSDTLTHILTLELFLDAVIICLAVILSLLIAWLSFALVVRKKYHE